MISCSDYDYIEIVCMYRYRVLLYLQSGQELEGVAKDTARDGNKQECIVLDVNGEQQLVVLDEIARLDVCVDNPHFKSVSFVSDA